MLLKDHIKLLKFLKDNSDIQEFLNQYRGMDKLNISRSLKENYPLKPTSTVTPIIKESFKVYTDVNNLVLGQFIMLEQIITGKTQLPEYQIDLEILKLILRPKHHTLFDNEKQQDEKDNEYKILNTDVLDVYAALNLFLENRNKTLFKDFSGVFYDVNDEEDQEEDKASEKTSEMLFQSQWYWYSIVRMLAQEDIRRYPDIYMLPMSTVLPEMSYLAQKNKIEDAQRRQSEAMRKL